jgi:RHS repeat-associated protein
VKKIAFASALGCLLFATPARASDHVYFFHNDHLGTPQAMSDLAGRKVWEAEYEPFGMATVTTATITNNLRLPGQYYDAETGLHYNYYRDYDSGTGRYLQPDPIGLEGGLNLYPYVLNNPVRFVDPQGLQVPWPEVLPAAEEVLEALIAAAAVATVAEKIKECTECPPCSPYQKGTIGYIGPHTGRPHYPVPAGKPHLNLWKVNQQGWPACKCFWNDLRFGVEPPPGPGWVDLNCGFPALAP